MAPPPPLAMLPREAMGHAEDVGRSKIQRVEKAEGNKIADKTRAPKPHRDMQALLAKPWGQVFGAYMVNLTTSLPYDAPVAFEDDAASVELANARGAEAWATATGGVMPFGNLSVSPAAGVLNYGQGLFEGLKAYRTPDDRIVVFRPAMNARRAMEGARRLCMPPVPEATFVAAVKAAVAANAAYVPPHGQGTLYIRPMLLGTGPQLGLFPAPTYSLVIYVSPVGSYFKGTQADPIDLHVETRCHRACTGGSGGVKAIGNYAPTLLPQKAAKAKKKDNCLYLDSVENKYIEEVGTCNVFCICKDGKTAKTPKLTGTILAGVTRDSIMTILRDAGYTVVEERVSVFDLLDAAEAFVTGTAVGVCPIGSLTYEGTKTTLNNHEIGQVTSMVTQELTGMQMGRTEDNRGWVEAITFDGADEAYLTTTTQN